jgi:hypothetical protein
MSLNNEKSLMVVSRVEGVLSYYNKRLSIIQVGGDDAILILILRINTLGVFKRGI